MPASLLTDMNSHSGGLEDQRALQLALELSMLGLNPDANSTEEGSSQALNPPYSEDSKKKSANMTECVPVPSSEHVAEIVGRQGCKIKALRAKTNTYIKTPVRGEEPVFVVTGRKEDVAAAKREILSAAEHFSQIRASRRNNGNTGVGGVLAPGPPSPNAPGQVTIQVRVPYRVVGLVVGPKGATIKRIQQQTHTYIVTPSRDKEPVFEVTGTPENVEKARQEIEGHIAMRTGGGLVDSNNANHVGGTVANGGQNGGSSGGGGGGGGGAPNVAPSADDAHLNQLNDFHSNGIDSGFHDVGTDLLSSIYKPPSSNSAFTSYNSTLNNSNNLLQSHRSQDSNIFQFPQMTTNGSAKLAEFPALANTNGFTSNGFGSLYDNDEGIASPTFDPTPGTLASVWPELNGPDNRTNGFNGLFGLSTTASNTSSSASMPRRSSSLSSSTTPRLSPTLTDSNGSPTPGGVATEHSTVRRIRSDPLSGGLAAMTTFAPLPANPQNFAASTSSSAASVASSASTSPTESTGSSSGTGSSGVGVGGMTIVPNAAVRGHANRNCMLCSDNSVVAALVPCGHNLFCMECANHLVEKPLGDRRCPVCQQPPTQAIRIFS